MSASTMVVGASRGIGLATATTLAEAGYAVAATYRSAPPPEHLFAVPCDVTDPDSVDTAFTKAEAEHGPVSVVVVNAGITEDQILPRMKEEQFVSVLDTNLTGAYRVARRAVRGMLRRRGGRIILMSSVVALHGSVGQANYAASKAGLIGLCRTLARELGSRGITVNTVAPGFVRTDMTDSLPPERKDAYLADIPLGRFAEPAEVASVVRFLAGDDAAYITGAIVPVDGGSGMGH